MTQKKATAKKRKKTHQAGYRPSGPFFRSALLTFGVIQLFTWQAPSLLNSLAETTTRLWSTYGTQHLSGPSIISLARNTIITCFALVAIPLALFYGLILTLAVSWQNFRSPKKSLKGPSSLYKSSVSMFGLWAMGGIILGLLFFALQDLVQGPLEEGVQKGLQTLSLGLQIFSWVVLIFGMADYVLGKRHFEKQLQMSPKELREEAREEQVSPQIQAERRELWETI